MSVLGVVLARGGSKGVPGKNIRLLNGRPLIAYTLDVAAQSKLIDVCVVSSDDPEILRVASEYGNAGLINRPAHLAQDDTPTLPALQHAVREAEERYGQEFDYIAELRATSPLKTVEDVDTAIALLIASGAESVIGVTELGDHHPARAKRLVNGRIRDFYMKEAASGRRQDLKPKAYIRNGTIYALKRDAVMGKDAKVFGHDFSLPMIMPEERSVNIDSERDWMLCEALIG